MSRHTVALFLIMVTIIAGILIIDSTATAGLFSKEKELIGSDGRSQIILPKGWKEYRKLHDNAEIQAAHLKKESYVIVLSENKEDFDEMTLEKHSKLTRTGILESLKKPTINRLPDLTINGRPAIQFEISGVINNIKIVYLHTTVETNEYFHQILAWTLKSKYNDNKESLQKVIKSFKEIK
jgi:hypothetical protein